MQRERNCERDEHVLTDYRDGFYFRNHKVFADNRDALMLHLYEDEFEVCNPLGSKRNKHKLCTFYYTVGNIGSKYCSQLKHIKSSFACPLRSRKKVWFRCNFEAIT